MPSAASCELPSPISGLFWPCTDEANHAVRKSHNVILCQWVAVYREYYNAIHADCLLIEFSRKHLDSIWVYPRPLQAFPKAAEGDLDDGYI